MVTEIEAEMTEVAEMTEEEMTEGVMIVAMVVGPEGAMEATSKYTLIFQSFPRFFKQLVLFDIVFLEQSEYVMTA